MWLWLRTNLLSVEFGKYFVSGLCAFVADFIVLVTLTEGAGLHFLVSNIFGYCAGLVVSYWINTRWVFAYRRYAERSAREFTLFVSIVLVALLVSEVGLYVVTSYFELPYTVAKVFSSAFVFLFNYVAKKFLLFSPGRS